jgi:hypothetical protein
MSHIKFSFTTSRGAHAAKTYKCTITEGQEIAVGKQDGHYAMLITAAAQMPDGFTLAELGAKAAECGLSIAKDGAKSTPESLAKYYKAKMVKAQLIAEA